MPTQQLDPARAEEFTGRLVGVLNDAALAPMLSLGHRLGLFDVMAGRPPATSADIARAAGLDERYVREWLAGLTVGRILEYDSAARTFVLPAEHAASLTRAAGADNMAMFMQYPGLLGVVEDQVLECFRRGGGLPYTAYPRFHALQAEESAFVKVPFVVERTIPLIEGMPARLEAGVDVADVGCGAGLALLRLAEAYPKSRFTGYDISDEAIGMGQDEAKRRGVSNVRFEVRDVADLGAEAKFDLITAFDTIHDQAKPRAVLRGIARALRPDGVLLMVDIAGSSHLEKNLDHPLGPFFYAVSTFHCMSVSLAQGGEGLGTMWGEERARELLAEAGFGQVEVKRVEADPFDLYYVARLG